MLVSYQGKNVLSFGDELISLSMETGKARGKRNHVIADKKVNLLRFSAIYGANSSGKSNFVKSIAIARSIIIKGVDDDRAISQFYNRTKIENKGRPSEFKFEFKLNKKLYEYSFSILLKDRKFTHETLTCEDKVVFSRNLLSDEYTLDIKCKDQVKIDKAKLFFDTTKEIDNVLFLTEMNLNKGNLYDERDEISILNDLFILFKKSIKIVTPKTRLSDMSILSTDCSKVIEVLDRFGFDVTKLVYKDDTAENVFRGLPSEVAEDIMKQIDKDLSDDSAKQIGLHGPDGIVKFKYEDDVLKIQTLKCQHGDNGEFSLSEESDGFRRLLDLIDIILSPKSGDIYIIDEIDRSFNSMLTKAFIDYYLNETYEQNTQLIITTHETRLLDLNMLRKDEIWMFNKEDGNTEITALTDFEGTIRSDVKLDAAYMDGRYRGVQKCNKGGV